VKKYLSKTKIINIKYYSATDKINRNGKFIISDVVADESLKLFMEIFKKKIVIEKINHSINYDSHEQSILDNNSLSFICNLDEKNKGFLYSYGLAFDINPLYNPALTYQNFGKEGKIVINSLSKSVKFINRRLNFKMKNEQLVDLFRKHGFSEWGGNWNYDINWQYFSVNPVVSNIMLSMDKADSIIFFQMIVKNMNFIDRFDKSEFALEIRYLYQKDGVKFLKVFGENFSKLKNLTDSQFFDLLRKKINYT
jgi:hypothetical protein